jgi:hypothetical protein
VYRANFNGQNGEVDHLVSLELGGTNATANLFPEAASPRPRQPREGPLGAPSARSRLLGHDQPSPRPEGDRERLGEGIQGLCLLHLSYAVSLTGTRLTARHHARLPGRLSNGIAACRAEGGPAAAMTSLRSCASEVLRGSSTTP